MGRICSKCAMQVTCIKEEYNSFSVLRARDTQRAASIKSNAKYSRLLPSCPNMSFTVLFTLLQTPVEDTQLSMYRLEFPSCPLEH